MKERQKEILFLITDEFIKTSIPVSSTRIHEINNLNCCSSTVRNEMIALERKGLIEKLHSSSGRIPTSKGYKYYLENQNKNNKFEGLTKSIEEIFKNRANSIDSVISQACCLISDVLKLPVVIFKNNDKNNQKRIQSIQLIKLESGRCMLVLIANNEVLVEKIISLDDDLISDLKLAIGLIGKRLFNSPLDEVIERLNYLIPLLTKNIESFEENFKTLILEVFKRALMSVNVYGTSNMLSTKELSNPTILKSIVSLLDNKNIWKLLNTEFSTTLENDETRLGFIETDEISVLSMEMENDLTLAVVGPKRVNYIKILSALDTIKRNLEENKKLIIFRDKNNKN